MKPKTRLENFLAKIAKDPDATTITPKTRKEYYLNEIAEKNDGGGGALVVTETNWTLDKTYADIVSAKNSGSVVMLYCTALGAPKIRYLDTVFYESNLHKYLVGFSHAESEEYSSYTYQSSSETGTLEMFTEG